MRKINILLTSLLMTIGLGIIGKADSLIPVTAGGVGVTYIYTSSTNPDINIQATYTLSLDRQLRFTVTNNSKDYAIGAVFVLYPDTWNNSVTTSMPWSRSDDYGSGYTAFWAPNFLPSYQNTVNSLLLPGRSGDFFIQIGTRPPDFTSTIPPTSFLLVIPGQTTIVSPNQTANANVSEVPEPATIILLSAGIGLGIIQRRRKKGIKKDIERMALHEL